jgi:hypothetical protein
MRKDLLRQSKCKAICLFAHQTRDISNKNDADPDSLQIRAKSQWRLRHNSGQVLTLKQIKAGRKREARKRTQHRADIHNSERNSCTGRKSHRAPIRALQFSVKLSQDQVNSSN